VPVYLEENPPAVSQFRRTRRATPSGVIVLHTAESFADVNPPDNGAENVARFIANRTNFGSYHVIADADSAIQLCEWWWEAWHVATHKMNHHSVGISLAAEAAKWDRYPNSWVDAAIDNAARTAAVYAQWIKSNHGVDIPAERISATKAINKTPGFTTHGELDPGRRSDPGADFPWSTFLDRYRHHLGEPPVNDRQVATVKRIQQALIDAGYDLGSFGADGDPGPLTEAAVNNCIQDRDDFKEEFQTVSSQLREVRAENEDLAIQVRTLETDLNRCREDADRNEHEAEVGRGFIDLVNKSHSHP